MKKDRRNKLHNDPERTNAKEGTNILPFRRNIRINIGAVIFLFIFGYLAYSFARYLTRDHFSAFRVEPAEAIEEAADYLALILRDEQAVLSPSAGYFDRYAAEGSRVKVDSLVATVDELGTVSERVRAAAVEEKLSSDRLLLLKDHLMELARTYEGEDFLPVYEQKAQLHSLFLSSADTVSGELIGKSEADAAWLHLMSSEKAGLISFFLDGYEEKRLSGITAEDFDVKKYSRSEAGALVSAGEFLFKTAASENWSLVIALTAEEAARYQAENSLFVTFLQYGIQTSCPVSVFTGADGAYYAELSLNRYMVRFISERYTRIRVSLDENLGYRVPESALIGEECYRIPVSMEDKASYEGERGFLVLTNGDPNDIDNTRFAAAEILYENEEYLYVPVSAFAENTMLVAPETHEVYVLRETESRSGVYCINSGITVFRPVEILAAHENYYLVRKGTKGGIKAYDQLLLNAKDYSAGKILTE